MRRGGLSARQCLQDRLVDRVPHLLLARHGPLRAGTGAVRAPLVTRTMQLSSKLAADQRSTNGGRSAHVPCWTSPQEDPRRDRPRHTCSPCRSLNFLKMSFVYAACALHLSPFPITVCLASLLSTLARIVLYSSSIFSCSFSSCCTSFRNSPPFCSRC